MGPAETLPQDAYRWLVASWSQRPAAETPVAVRIADAFGHAPLPNDLNRVIVGLCQAGQIDDALEAAGQMQAAPPRMETFNALVLGAHKAAKAAAAPAARLGHWLDRIRATMHAARLTPDATTHARLLRAAQALGEPARLRAAITDARTVDSPVVHAALVHAYLSLGDVTSAQAELAKLLSGPPTPTGDASTHAHAHAHASSPTPAAAAALMRALAGAEDFEGALAVHARLEEAGIPESAAVLVAALSTLLKAARQLGHHLRPWRPLADRALALPDADVAVYTAVVQLHLHEPALLRSGVRQRADEALDVALSDVDGVLAHMAARGVTPDNMLLSALLRAYANWWPQQAADRTPGARLDRALRVLATARPEVAPNAHVYTALVLCCKDPVRDAATGQRQERLDARLDDVLQSMRRDGVPMDAAVYTAWAHVLLTTHEPDRLLQLWGSARLDATTQTATAVPAQFDALVLHEAATAHPAAAARALALYHDLRMQGALSPPSAATYAALFACCGTANDTHAFDAALADLYTDWARHKTRLPGAPAASAGSSGDGWDDHDVGQAYSAAVEAAAKLQDLGRAEAAFQHVAAVAGPALTSAAWQALLRITVHRGSLSRAEALWADPVAAPAWNAIAPALTMATARANAGRFAVRRAQGACAADWGWLGAHAGGRAAG